MSRLFKKLAQRHKQVGAHYLLVLILRLRQMCCHPALIKAMLDKEELEMASNRVSAQSFSDDMLKELDELMTDDDDDDSDTECSIDERIARNVMSRVNPTFRNDRKSSKVLISLFYSIEEVFKIISILHFISFR